jgi:hypothetical protein
MSAANLNPMEKSMVSVLIVEDAGGGGRCCHVVGPFGTHCCKHRGGGCHCCVVLL